MKLLAAYTTANLPDLELRNLETGELIHTVTLKEQERSLSHVAQAWAKENGHTIAEWDRSNLT